MTEEGIAVMAVDAGSKTGPARRPGRGIPRPLEVILAMAGLALASPVMLLAAAAVRLGSPGPVLFRQERVGRGGRPFVLFKFRTMREGQSGPMITAKGDERVTRVGRMLRGSKLDELPELWNVLRGEMSLVGPRPEVREYVDPGDPLWQEILQVRPGITDPVTVTLRDEEGLLASGGGDPEGLYREVLQPYKLSGYADYMARRTPWTDLKVMARTIWAVLFPWRMRPPSMDELRGGRCPSPPGGTDGGVRR